MTAEEYYQKKFPHKNIKGMVCTNIYLKDLFKIMQEYAEQYHKEKIKDILLDYEKWQNSKIGKDYNNLSEIAVNEYLRNKSLDNMNNILDKMNNI